MIDFRYHLVSIVAVFLALAIGIVLGFSISPDTVITPLKKATSDLRSDNEHLRADQRESQRQAESANGLVGALSPQMVTDQLRDERVVIVEAPGATDDTRGKLAGLVRKAGGTITGSVVLQAKYLNPSQDNIIDGLADQLRPPRLKLPKGTPRARAATELADAVLTDKSSKAGQEEGASDAVLAGFRDAGYLTTTGNPAARATLAVLLAPQAPLTGTHAEDGNTALVALAQALDQRGRGAVLAGNATSAGNGGLLTTLAEHDKAAAKVSSVNNIGTVTGQVVTVFALAAEIKDHTGAYGTGAAPVPSPVPTLQGAAPKDKPKGKG